MWVGGIAVASLAVIGFAAQRGSTRCKFPKLQATEEKFTEKEAELLAAAEGVTERRHEAIAKGSKGPIGRTIANDVILRVARGEKSDHVPKWMHRQAGRYLPEFREVRGINEFFKVCQSPALATEVTLQPLRRFPDLNAVIIFSDILVIPQAMGMECEMRPGQGPVFPTPLTDLSQLNMTPNIEETLGYVFDAIFHTCEKQSAGPVFGFAGAPWTLMAYMIEGGGSKNWNLAKRWLYERPEDSKKLLRAISVIIVDYLVAQIDAGASMVQVFDTNAGELPPGLYDEFCVEDLKWIAAQVKEKRPGAIVSLFNRNGPLAPFNDSEYNVVSLSWTVRPEEARAALPDKFLQGNLEPCVLYAPEIMDEEVEKMAKAFGRDKWIANLGHGMLPDHTPEGAGKYIELITKL
jgi:uroporphyrinogen decarboxylase